ncbi:hypothetical protein HBI25_122680 [Parastagonospora nodorum]|nr:hypothetical protein HBH52_099000 [Parastagonospora nodorum]KAH4048767.1 hypothetical protein HBH49_151030 [Parastagonospora nodorum]KAH4103777.1 hypothetical protein HBH46_104250 [Parastagonospora nodorum]KAH4232236.1 hypothetical protein HBI05_176020 [Parastagonospora nodorum]KAH4266493.1 hypothetical protein HBI03_075490 [Parastagonospora nodorum]
MPAGLALYAFPHRPFEETFNEEAGEAVAEEDRVEVASVEHVVDELDGVLDEAPALEHVPNFWLHPTPQAESRARTREAVASATGTVGGYLALRLGGSGGRGRSCRMNYPDTQKGKKLPVEGVCFAL